LSRKFYLSDPPISAADVAREREQAERTIVASKRRDKGFLIYAVIMIPSLLSFLLLVVVPAVGNPDTAPGIIGTIALYTPYVIGFMFFTSLTAYHKFVEKPRKLARGVLADLEEIGPEDLAAVLAGAPSDADIDEYQRRVAALGRGLLRGELDAIQRRIDRLRAAAAETEPVKTPTSA
jgi:hypothetical protein